MSSKLGVVLSMIFVIMFFLLAGDMICLSYIYASLDSKSITISYIISKSGRVDDEFLDVIEERYNVSFLTISPSNPSTGEIVDFVIYQNYQPLIIAKNEIVVKASRQAILGYYG